MGIVKTREFLKQVTASLLESFCSIEPDITD
jgi:hypothetical protein